MNRLVVSARAARDIESILKESDARFGKAVEARYRRLVVAALQQIRTDPVRVGVRPATDLRAGLRLYHLRWARGRTSTAGRIGNPRHVLVFQYDGAVFEVLRILHDAMDFPRHFDEEASS